MKKKSEILETINSVHIQQPAAVQCPVENDFEHSNIEIFCHYQDQIKIY